MLPCSIMLPVSIPGKICVLQAYIQLHLVALLPISLGMVVTRLACSCSSLGLECFQVQGLEISIISHGKLNWPLTYLPKLLTKFPVRNQPFGLAPNRIWFLNIWSDPKQVLPPSDASWQSYICEEHAEIQIDSSPLLWASRKQPALVNVSNHWDAIYQITLPKQLHAGLLEQSDAQSASHFESNKK